MFDFFKKIKFLNINNKRKPVSYEKTGINPKKDWSKIIVLTFVALVLGGFLSLYFYIQIENGALFKTDYETPNVTSLNKQALDRVISEMEEKQILADSINSSKSSLADPAR